jgi:hypothetical protein
VRLDFADLPEYLRVEIAAAWWLLESEAAAYFDTRTTTGRWEIVSAFLATSPAAALQIHLAQADSIALRDLGHIVLARSRALEAAA